MTSDRALTPPPPLPMTAVAKFDYIFSEYVFKDPIPKNYQSALNHAENQVKPMGNI
mgnify:CR=1 FL=1